MASVDKHATKNHKKEWSVFVSCLVLTLLVTCRYCDARRISIEGIGVMIRATDKKYRYKSDHLDTASFNGGLIFPKSSIPSQVKGMEYASHDFRPRSDDSRTNDHIKRIKADTAGDLLIAMPSPAARGDEWQRLTPGSAPNYYLDYATRRGTFTPDTHYPYWFYKRNYNTQNTWVSLPANSISTNLPPFVFASKGELYWINPPALMPNAVTIARIPENTSVTTLANPNLIIMPNGDYLASITHAAGTSSTSIWKSVDRGLTWSLLKDGFSVNRYSLFQHRGSIYLLGMNTKGPGKTRIYKSSDNGATWTDSVFAGLGGEDAPSHVDIVNGRIWKAALTNAVGGRARGPGFFSAPVDADLMKESSWTLSAPGATWGARFGETYNLTNGQAFKPGNEGTLLKTRQGRLVNAGKSVIYRPEDGLWKDGIALIYADFDDITKTTFDADHAGPRLPGTNTKYTVRYGPVSDKYWALTSGGINRGQLNLYSSSNLRDFQFRTRILEGHSTGYHGFNYPFMQIDGDDIIFVSRTAWDTHRGTATRWHDGNLFTFHRIKEFRDSIINENRLETSKLKR
jgi:hypothetical protein